MNNQLQLQLKLQPQHQSINNVLHNNYYLKLILNRVKENNDQLHGLRSLRYKYKFITSVEWMVYNKYFELLKVKVERGERLTVSQNGMRLLFLKVEDHEMIKKMLQQYKEEFINKPKAIEFACLSGSLELVQQLIGMNQSSMNAGARTPLDIGWMAGDPLLGSLVAPRGGIELVMYLHESIPGCSIKDLGAARMVNFLRHLRPSNREKLPLVMKFFPIHQLYNLTVFDILLSHDPEFIEWYLSTVQKNSPDLNIKMFSFYLQANAIFFPTSHANTQLPKNLFKMIRFYRSESTRQEMLYILEKKKLYLSQTSRIFVSLVNHTSASGSIYQLEKIKLVVEQLLSHYDETTPLYNVILNLIISVECMDLFQDSFYLYTVIKALLRFGIKDFKIIKYFMHYLVYTSITIQLERLVDPDTSMDQFSILIRLLYLYHKSIPIHSLKIYDFEDCQPDIIHYLIANNLFEPDDDDEEEKVDRKFYDQTDDDDEGIYF
ncbi:hypothetical protein DFA_06700 [Cavenderia fasciculata]|uniref:Ankyrin repeat-containing protein n=1 Tax=Cavenderia fasciculata TaxID=261658 RepID=F4Q213_CACFS|nr:uncharacterized protein DFA_06700 [Cavenderia fasciculata]EGG18033.1 hypothetical protein DFA_06700 [Cavenderia fasciculata]|eukprot:XP_004356926.1 hypothetical protein DFA_06700 [Cavenderia fasciculata]